MRAELFWIPADAPGRLAIAPRPRGDDWLEDEVASFRAQGVDVLVTLLDDTEVAELGLAGLRAACEANGIAHHRLPIPDRGVPSAADGLRALVVEMRDALAAGRGVAIHCRQGIGRSSLVAGAVLVAGGRGADDALRAIAAARGRPVPDTPEQAEWLRRFRPPG